MTLASWVKIPVGLLGGLGLLNYPIGTVINSAILYIIFCKKGRTVLSKEYEEIIAATPDVRYKTSVVTWVFVGLLLTGIAGVIIVQVVS